MIAVAAIFTIHRLLILLTNSEWVSNQEELYRGALGLEILRGLALPLWDYQADAYCGGSVVMGILNAAVFKWVPPSLFALKLVPLLFFSLPSFFITLLILKKHFGNSAARWGSLLLIFSPPGFTAASLTAIGDHQESILFSAIMLFCFYQLRNEPLNKGRWAILLGAAAGIGFWFAGITFVSFFACAGSLLLIQNGRIPWRKILLGAMVGLTPWIFYNAVHGFSGLKFLLSLYMRTPEDTLIHENPPQSFFYLIFYAVPKSLVAPGWVGYFWGAFLGMMIVLIVFYLRRADRFLLSKYAPSLIFSVIFIAAFYFSRLEPPRVPTYIESRYFQPLHFFLIFLAAAAIPLRPSIFKVLAAGILFLGLLSQKELVFQEPFARALQYRGYSYFDMGKLLANKSMKLIETKDDLTSHDLFYRWGVYQGWELPEALKDSEAFRDTLASLSPAYQHLALEGWGKWWGLQPLSPSKSLPPLENFSHNERKFIYRGLAFAAASTGEPYLRQFQHLTQEIPSDVHPLLYFYLGVPLMDSDPTLSKRTFSIIDTLPGEAQKQVYRGAGSDFASNWAWLKLSFQRSLAILLAREVPEKSLSEFYWGIGWGLRLEFREDRTRGLDWLKRLPEAAQVAALQGFKACEEWYDIPD